MCPNNKSDSLALTKFAAQNAMDKDGFVVKNIQVFDSGGEDVQTETDENKFTYPSETPDNQVETHKSEFGWFFESGKTPSPPKFDRELTTLCEHISNILDNVPVEDSKSEVYNPTGKFCQGSNARNNKYSSIRHGSESDDDFADCFGTGTSQNMEGVDSANSDVKQAMTEYCDGASSCVMLPGAAPCAEADDEFDEFDSCFDDIMFNEQDPVSVKKCFEPGTNKTDNHEKMLHVRTPEQSNPSDGALCDSIEEKLSQDLQRKQEDKMKEIKQRSRHFTTQHITTKPLEISGKSLTNVPCTENVSLNERKEPSYMESMEEKLESILKAKSSKLTTTITKQSRHFKTIASSVEILSDGSPKEYIPTGVINCNQHQHSDCDIKHLGDTHPSSLKQNMLDRTLSIEDVFASFYQTNPSVSSLLKDAYTSQTANNLR